MIVKSYLDYYSNSGANTCTKPQPYGRGAFIRLYVFMFRRLLSYTPPEEIASTCNDMRDARLPKMEQAFRESRCSLKAWIPDKRDIEDEEEIVLSR